ncbi:MAG TPA: hypothetical protein VE131_04355 [Terriglobales bacterium]|nr:hypothetical protein [Terriglobales bacterium]
MAQSTLERQQRWQARHLVKLTAPAGEIAAKLQGIAHKEKFAHIMRLIGGRAKPPPPMPRTAAESAAARQMARPKSAQALAADADIAALLAKLNRSDE